MKILALDFGDVRIGLATSDSLGIIATGRETYVRKSEKDDFIYLKNFIEQEKVERVVIGLPLNMDGTEGERAILTRDFGDNLAEYVNIPISYFDERLTSIEAEKILITHNMKRKKRKDIIDQLAATIILRSYLDSQNQ